MGVELLVIVQLFFTPCEFCQEGSQLALVANLIEASSATLLWRGHFIENLGAHEPDEITDQPARLLAEFLEVFSDDIRPKWQRQRFHNLARREGDQ